MLTLLVKDRKRTAIFGLLMLLMIAVLAGFSGRDLPESDVYPHSQVNLITQISQPDLRLPLPAAESIRLHPENYAGYTAWFNVRGYDATVNCLFTSDGKQWYRNTSDVCSKFVEPQIYDYYRGLPNEKRWFQANYKSPDYTIQYDFQTKVKTRHEVKTGMTYYDLNGTWVTYAAYTSALATRQASFARVIATLKAQYPATPTRVPGNTTVLATPVPNSTSIAATQAMSSYQTVEAERQKIKIWSTMDSRNSEVMRDIMLGPDCYMDPYDYRCP